MNAMTAAYSSGLSEPGAVSGMVCVTTVRSCDALRCERPKPGRSVQARDALQIGAVANRAIFGINVATLRNLLLGIGRRTRRLERRLGFSTHTVGALANATCPIVSFAMVGALPNR